MPARRRAGAGGDQDATAGGATGDEQHVKGASSSGPQPQPQPQPGGGRWSPAAVVGLLTAAVVLPRAAHLCYYHAHLHAGWQRPPVALAEERPLLIVGTMCARPPSLWSALPPWSLLLSLALASGTKQMSVELGKLGLEVGHETSDTGSQFCRDGTVSWTHGLRFLPRAAARPELAAAVCAAPRFHAFHPTMFRPSAACSYHWTFWSRCWAAECADLWARELGCHHPAPGAAAAGNQTACTSRFTRALLQVRHPLKVLASLIAKAGPACNDAGSHIVVVRAMFPDFDWGGLRACAEFWGWYWVLYNRAMLPHVDGWFRVEDSPPCEVAAAGVLLAPGSAAAAACAARPPGEGPGHGERHGTVNRVNRRRAEVSWADVRGLPNGLGDEMARLAALFGYTD
eukprot:jgi/Tetstr1/422654/TSEL_013459.t1